jgi:hypothetical protein
MGRIESRGPGSVLGGPGVSESDVYRVRTLAKLAHFFLRFAGEIMSRPLCGPIQARVGWLPRSGQLREVSGSSLEMPLLARQRNLHGLHAQK